MNSTDTASRKTGYHCGAKNVEVSVTSGLRKERESICDLKTVIGSSTGSKRNCAVSAASGRLRVSFIIINQPEMV